MYEVLFRKMMKMSLQLQVVCLREAPMDLSSKDIQYLIQEHIFESNEVKGRDNGWVKKGEQLHLRWNSQKGTIFIDEFHMTHDLELGDGILINSDAPPLQLFVNDVDA
eukprot:294656_1